MSWVEFKFFGVCEALRIAPTRPSKSRNKVAVGEPAAGSSYIFIILMLCFSLPKITFYFFTFIYNKEQNQNNNSKSYADGFLGFLIDDERGKMR